MTPFFHSHLKFSSTFLMLTSNKIIDKIESMPKIAIRLLIGLTKNKSNNGSFLGFRNLGIFNVVKFLFQLKKI